MFLKSQTSGLQLQMNNPIMTNKCPAFKNKQPNWSCLPLLDLNKIVKLKGTTTLKKVQTVRRSSNPFKRKNQNPFPSRHNEKSFRPIWHLRALGIQSGIEVYCQIAPTWPSRWFVHNPKSSACKVPVLNLIESLSLGWIPLRSLWLPLSGGGAFQRQKLNCNLSIVELSKVGWS